MEFDINARAPGKILWIGGYSVLEKPNVSYVTAVTAYVHARVQEMPGNAVELVAPQLNCNIKGTIDFDSGRILAEVPKEMLLMKTAAETASRYIAVLGVKPKGFRLTTNSDSPFSYIITAGKVAKSGLGSSAAVTSATISALLQAFDVDHKKNDALHKLAQTAHSIATGKVGSGFDIAAATHGSIIYTRYSPEIVQSLPADYTNSQLLELVKREWDYSIEPFRMPGEIRLSFANFVGESMITTKAVGSVSAFKKKDPDTYGALIKEINAENIKAVDALRKMKNHDLSAYETFKGAFDAGRALTKRLGVLSGVGVEPDECTSLIEESKKHGAFVAKLPGAGGKDAISALTLDVGSKTHLEHFWKGRHELNVQNIDISPV
jgi:phosphomevalonate kinase